MAEDRLHGTIEGNDCPFAKKKTAFEELAMNSREYFLSFPYAAWKPGMAVAPDWLLGGLFGLGGIGGMYCGARLQKHVPATLIKSILAACMLFMAASYLGPLLG